MTTPTLTPAVRTNSDPSIDLLRRLGVSVASSIAASPAEPEIDRFPHPQDLPLMPDRAESVKRACDSNVYRNVLVRALDHLGNVDPTQALRKMRRYAMAPGGLMMFKPAVPPEPPDPQNPDGLVAKGRGVPLRVKPYRADWVLQPDGKRLPMCVSPDHIHGFGNPGGDCETCPLREWRGREERYCRSKTRLYMVSTSSPEPAIFDFPAMVREGLQPLTEYCDTYQLPLHRLVVDLSLVRHERQMGSTPQAKVQVAIVGLLPHDPDLDQAVADANANLELMEQAWARGVANFASFSKRAGPLDSTQRAELPEPRAVVALPEPPETPEAPVTVEGTIAPVDPFAADESEDLGF